MAKSCSVEGCGRVHQSRGFCSMHYQRLLKHGSADKRTTSPGEALDYLFNVVFTYENKKECLIWPYARNYKGYGQIGYKSKTRNVSRLACRKIRGKPPSRKHEACHSCGRGKQGCVNPHHVYWGTSKQNSADRIRHGTARGPNGVLNGSAKLTDKKVIKILSLIEQGYSNNALAKKYGVSAGAISFIRLGRTWKHIERLSK